jgi:hypothetical protein
MIPGVDLAGIVMSAGIVISAGDHTGQEVWGSAPALGMTRPGTHARFVIPPETARMCRLIRTPGQEAAMQSYDRDRRRTQHERTVRRARDLRRPAQAVHRVLLQRHAIRVLGDAAARDV